MPDKAYSRIAARMVRALFSCLLLVCAAAALCPAQQAAPVLLTEGTGATTRAVVFDSVTRHAEPFSVNAPVRWSADGRTRVMLFAMNLQLLPGEGANAITADAEDGNHRRYPLKVEHVGKVPGQDWLYSIIVRLSDDMNDSLGDVFVRISHHGTASNRVRFAVGQVGGGLSDQTAGAVPAPAPPVAPAPLPVPTPKAYAPGEVGSADTTRLLEQATWGPTTAEVARVQSMGLRAFLNEQFGAPPLFPGTMSNYPNLPFPLDDSNQGCPTGSPAECLRDNYSNYPFQVQFFKNSLTGQDQLRQRVAFALHQIFVVSARDINRPSWYVPYLQALDRNAFGNFRTLLQEMTLNPGMGEYLDMRRSTAASPNENFAREILQLFSIGTVELNTDGTPKLDAQGKPLASYSQSTIDNFTRVFTGWNLAPQLAQGTTNYRDPMVPRGGTTHDTGSKTLLSGAVVPAGQTAQQDLNAALDNIFNHPNVGPFIGKQLIQHLVTSNPSPAYVERVARAFNNDCDALYADGCTGARGSLRAVVQAILLDPEARGDMKTDPHYGRLREPVQLVNNVLRAFGARSFDGTTTSDFVLGTRSPDFPNTMDQPLFLPATVFSYYQPDYEVPGTKILGPAFGILSTSTTLRRANFINTMVYTGITPTTTSTDRPRGTSLNLAPFDAPAANPQQLLDALDALLLHGTMSAEMRASLMTAVNTIPATDTNFARKRVLMAVYLVLTSSQYDIQR